MMKQIYIESSFDISNVVIDRIYQALDAVEEFDRVIIEYERTAKTATVKDKTTEKVIAVLRYDDFVMMPVVPWVRVFSGNPELDEFAVLEGMLATIDEAQEMLAEVIDDLREQGVRHHS